MERKERAHERPRGPNNVVRRLRASEDKNATLHLELEALETYLQASEMQNKALHQEMQELKREISFCRRKHGNVVETDRERFLCQQNADLHKKIEELQERLQNTDELARTLEVEEVEEVDLRQDMLENRLVQRKRNAYKQELATKLKVASPQQEKEGLGIPQRENATNLAAEKEMEFLRRKNEDLRTEMKECIEKLQSDHELAMKSKIRELKEAHWKEIEELKLAHKDLAMGIEDVATEVKTQREEKEALCQEKEALRRDVEELNKMLQKEQKLSAEREAENEDLRKKMKDFTEELHSATELAMKNKRKNSEMEEKHQKEVDQLTALHKKIASSTATLTALLKEQKEALHQEKEALQRKVEELNEMLEKEKTSSNHEQTIKVKALELEIEELKKLRAEEEALTIKNLSIELKAEKEEKEALHQKLEEYATQLKVEEELPKKTKKPSMLRRFAKLFTSNKRKEKKNGKKKEKMESA